MASVINGTPLDFLKPMEVENPDTNTLARLINRHYGAYFEFSQHCMMLAEDITPSAPDEAKARKLGEKERNTARDFVAYRPRCLEECVQKPRMPYLPTRHSPKMTATFCCIRFFDAGKASYCRSRWYFCWFTKSQLLQLATIST